MANTTGFLFLQLSSLLNLNIISRVITSVIQKVEKTLYVQVKELPLSLEKNEVSIYNNVVNEIYQASSRNAVHNDRFDTRVVLSNMRDSLMHHSPAESLSTNQPVNLVLYFGQEKNVIDSSCLKNLASGFISEAVMLEKSNSSNPQEGTQYMPDQLSNKFKDIPNFAMDEMYEHVVLGGTFDRLHDGHKMLLSAAVLRCKKSLTMGVTDGCMIHTKKLWELIEPCSTRIKKLEEFLIDIEPRLEYRIVPITDPYGPTAYDTDLQLLVVSEETLKGGFKVNELRSEKGMNLLDIYPIALIDDTQASAHEENKISSSSLRKRLLGTHIRPPKDQNIRPYVIGLTGGIASGKTTICNRLKEMGARIISCDHLGHAAYKKDTTCYNQMVQYFGQDILNTEGEIDRKKLGPIVFSNKDHLNRLNEMVWPEIRRLYLQEIEAIKRDNYKGIVILDAAILLEAGWDQDCQEVWVSIVPPGEAIKRITERDNLPVDQATKRVESQLSNSDRVKKANVVLCSVWEKEVTQQQVANAWQHVQNYYLQ